MKVNPAHRRLNSRRHTLCFLLPMLWGCLSLSWGSSWNENVVLRFRNCFVRKFWKLFSWYKNLSLKIICRWSAWDKVACKEELEYRSAGWRKDRGYAGKILSWTECTCRDRANLADNFNVIYQGNGSLTLQSETGIFQFNPNGSALQWDPQSCRSLIVGQDYFNRKSSQGCDIRGVYSNEQKKGFRPFS